MLTRSWQCYRGRGQGPSGGPRDTAAHQPSAAGQALLGLQAHPPSHPRAAYPPSAQHLDPADCSVGPATHLQQAGNLEWQGGKVPPWPRWLQWEPSPHWLLLLAEGGGYWQWGPAETVGAGVILARKGRAADLAAEADGQLDGPEQPILLWPLRTSGGVNVSPFQQHSPDTCVLAINGQDIKCFRQQGSADDSAWQSCSNRSINRDIL